MRRGWRGGGGGARQTPVFGKNESLLKVTLLHECFSRSLNCTNGIKSRNASHLLLLQYLKFY